ncbi:MAG TPA: SGNH/GDSL hydrolase family protein [Verrucomicrobiae bacterium]|nr:SGNH/GDSL hydrolase family protein [Verrucomicrobiae bacterium]
MSLAFALGSTAAWAADATTQAAEKTPPSLRPIVDVPGLPRVLLIGDSISLGYTVRVREALKGKANVHRALTNCGATRKGIAEIDSWLGEGKWDLIHFNFGLHDIRRLKTDVVAVPPAEYESNLRKLVERMKRTGAKLVWASTTPAPPEPKAGQFQRVPSDVVKYNEIAARVMKGNDVATDDLYSVVVERTAELQPQGDVHFNSKGYDVLAEQVVKSIAASLPGKVSAQ